MDEVKKGKQGNLRIVHPSIAPYVLEVMYNGYQVKEKLSNGTYQPWNQVMPTMKHIVTHLSQLLLSEMTGEIDPVQHYILAERMQQKLEALFIRGEDVVQEQVINQEAEEIK